MDPDVIEIPPPQAPIVSRSHSTEQQKNKQVLVKKKLLSLLNFEPFSSFILIMNLS